MRAAQADDIRRQRMMLLLLVFAFAIRMPRAITLLLMPPMLPVAIAPLAVDALRLIAFRLLILPCLRHAVYAIIAAIKRADGARYARRCYAAAMLTLRCATLMPYMPCMLRAVFRR